MCAIPSCIYGRDVDETTWTECPRVQFHTAAPNGAREFGLLASDIYTPEKKSAASCLDDAEKAKLVDASEEISLGGKEKVSHRIKVGLVSNFELLFDEMPRSCICPLKARRQRSTGTDKCLGALQTVNARTFLGLP